MRRADIVDGTRAGGPNTSSTISLNLLERLLAAVPPDAPYAAYVEAITEENVLGRATFAGRAKILRHLRQLYLLDPQRLLFRALRDLWDEDPASRPLLAGLVSFARDSVFRASADAVLPAPYGALITPQDLVESTLERFPGSYNSTTAATIGRNTAASWRQTGHLAGYRRKVRVRAAARPANVALALLVGHMTGTRGAALFVTPWAQFIDRSEHDLLGLAQEASRMGYLELRSVGGVTEIGFRHLLRPTEGAHE